MQAEKKSTTIKQWCSYDIGYREEDPSNLLVHSHGQQGLFVNVWTVYTAHPTQDSFVHKCFSTLATNCERQVIVYQGPHGAKYN